MTTDAQNTNANGEPPVTPTDEPKWWIDDKTPGVGDRPDWLGQNFKNAAHLAESYKELEKKLGYVPDDYDLSKSKFIDDAYEPFQELKALAKEKRVPREVMDKMVESFDKYLDEFSNNDEEEMTKFGDNAKERLTTLNNWAKANLSQASFDALTGTLRTADSLKALEEIRGKMMSTNTVVPGGNETALTNQPTLEDVTAEMTKNLQQYKTDPKYRAELQGRLALAAKGNTSFVDK